MNAIADRPKLFYSVTDWSIGLPKWNSLTDWNVGQPKSASLTVGRSEQRIDIADAATTTESKYRHSRLAKSNIKYLSEILRQLETFANLVESEPEDQISPLAFLRTREILVDASIFCAILGGRKIPFGHAVPDGNRGARIEWKKESSRVVLAVFDDQRMSPYVYHEIDGRYGTVEATGEFLSRWLKFVE